MPTPAQELPRGVSGLILLKARMLVEVWGIERGVFNFIFEILVLRLLLKALERVFGSIHHFHVILDIDSLRLKPFIESTCELIIDDFPRSYLLSAFEVLHLRQII